jgi:hypothetical protein
MANTMELTCGWRLLQNWGGILLKEKQLSQVWLLKGLNSDINIINTCTENYHSSHMHIS